MYYAEFQMHIFRTFRKKKPVPIFGSSQSVLHYALSISCQSTISAVHVAVTLSTDQSIATILLLQTHLKPEKVENDISWVMIHAVVQTFNIISVQECFTFGCARSGCISTADSYAPLCCSNAEAARSTKLPKLQ